MSDHKITVGALEECDLPELNIFSLNVRVDSGAKTSSIHVDNLVKEDRDGVAWVVFDIHPDIYDVDRVVRRSSKLLEERTIKSSNGETELRYVIQTTICMGSKNWQIEVTLTDRSNMSYLMLLGRQAMKGKLIIDPEHEYMLGKRPYSPGINQE